MLGSITRSTEFLYYLGALRKVSVPVIEVHQLNYSLHVEEKNLLRYPCLSFQE